MADGTLARDAGDYQERAVVPALQTHFSSVWVNRFAATVPASIVVVPDGAIDLQWIAGQWRIAGPDKNPQTESLPAGAVVVGFRFQPGAAADWLRVSALELCNRRVPLRDILGSVRATMDAAAERDDAGTLDRLETVLSKAIASKAIGPKHSTSISRSDHAMREAYRLIAAGVPHGKHVVPWLMNELAMSERTLRRRFELAFGYGPKTLDCILRFQRYLDLTRRRAESSTARRAAAAGYADHAHLVRECRRLALCTPSELE